jgi:hypothetical protein
MNAGTDPMAPAITARPQPLRRPVLSLALWALLAVCGPMRIASAQAPDPNAALGVAMDAVYYESMNRASKDNVPAIESAADQYGKLLAANPGNPLVLAYTGAATALRAYSTILPWKKIRYVEDGLALIDKSLLLLTPDQEIIWPNGTPVGVEARFVAAKTFLDVPPFFNRHARGERLMKEVLAHPQLANAPLDLRGEIWLQAAQQALDDKRGADARRWYETIISAKAPQSAKAQARLKELSP